MSELKEKLLESLIHFLDSLPPELIVMIVSCFPIIELRGSIPLALSVFQMPFWEAYAWGVVGNMLPILPLLILFQPLSKFLMRYSWYSRMYSWLYYRTMRKGKDIEKYGALGLILFTAIPIPTTGAWTACLAASFFNIRLTYAFISIFIGVLLAGLIMGGFSYSIFK